MALVELGHLGIDREELSQSGYGPRKWYFLGQLLDTRFWFLVAILATQLYFGYLRGSSQSPGGYQETELIPC